MRGLLLTTFVVVGAWTADAWGQFGLYGSPEVIDLPQSQAEIMPGYGPLAREPAPLPAVPQAFYAEPAPAYGDEAFAGRPEHLPPAPGDPRPGRGPRGRGAPRLPSDAPSKPEPPLEPQPARDANLVDQMLREPGPGGVYGDSGTDRSPLAQAVSGCDPCATDCAPCVTGCDYCPWFVSATGLIMGRDQPNRYWVSYETNNSPNQLLHTNDIPMQWKGGGEVRFGRRFCCGTWAIEAAYWTLEPFEGMASVTSPAGVSTPIDLQQVWFYRDALDWNMAADLFDGAVEHRLWRRNEFHNVEINILRTGMLCDPQHPLDVNWGLGVRWFRFEEDLVFGSLHDGAWGDAGGAREAYLDNNIVNDLVGVQLSLDVNYYLRPNWRVFLTPRFGLYNNHIDQDFQVYRGDGVVASPQPGSGVDGAYPVRASTDTLSFLTQVDVGVDWRFARNWSAGVGYRVMIATGIGLADNQIPHYLIDLPEVSHIDHNGHLILHGAFASLTFNF